MTNLQAHWLATQMVWRMAWSAAAHAHTHARTLAALLQANPLGVTDSPADVSVGQRSARDLIRLLSGCKAAPHNSNAASPQHVGPGPQPQRRLFQADAEPPHTTPTAAAPSEGSAGGVPGRARPAQRPAGLGGSRADAGGRRMGSRPGVASEAEAGGSRAAGWAVRSPGRTTSGDPSGSSGSTRILRPQGSWAGLGHSSAAPSERGTCSLVQRSHSQASSRRGGAPQVLRTASGSGRAPAPPDAAPRTRVSQAAGLHSTGADTVAAAGNASGGGPSSQAAAGASGPMPMGRTGPVCRPSSSRTAAATAKQGASAAPAGGSACLTNPSPSLGPPLLPSLPRTLRHSLALDLSGVQPGSSGRGELGSGKGSS